MASLRDQFQHFYMPTEEDIAAALRTGLVTPDTNVLLSLYRFQSDARDELLGALERIGDRLWIPYQVALEFHRNRLSVIAEQERYFEKTREVLQSSMNDYLAKLKAFSARIALYPADSEATESTIREAHDAVIQAVFEAERGNEVHLDSRDSDEVLARLETLFHDRVGEPMNPKELDDAKKEAGRRIVAKIPPGYMDKEKSDASGDYLIWKQLLKEAASRKLPVVLITDDRKEDWYWRIHGRTIGARYELREEMTIEAGVPFLIMSIETFLLHAKDYLQVSVSRATVDQAKEIQEARVQEAIARTRRAVAEENLARLATQERMLRETSTVLAADCSRIQNAISDATAQITAYAEAMNDRERKQLQASRENLLQSLGAVKMNLAATRQREAELAQELGRTSRELALYDVTDSHRSS